MRTSVKKGFSFGLTSGIITTLGLIIGLNSSTHSKLVIIGGILIIAVADALSDSFGMHISEEYEIKHSLKEIWESTIATFLSKFVFALSFVIPIILFTLSTAIIISIIWGLSLISIFSYFIAKKERRKPSKIVIGHLFMAVLVIIITHYLGKFVVKFFS